MVSTARAATLTGVLPEIAPVTARVLASFPALACTLALLLGAPAATLAQLPAAAEVAAAQPQRPPIALEAAKRLLAPVALFPDPVLSAVLEAATTPLDVVEAERFLTKREKDPTLQPDPEWSPAVVALLNHPELLRRMSEDLDWTRALGTAVAEDLPVVQEAIQEIRRGALALGLLADTEFQRVVVEEDVIAIEPVDPELVRLPVYDAEALLAALASAPQVRSAAQAPSEPALAPPPPKPVPPPPPASVAEREPALVPPAPLSAYEPYPAVPTTPPTVSYGPPERSFWSDAAIFAGGAVLGGILGYILADRDDDKKVVKKYYYFGDRRPHWWWRERVHWRDDDWPPRRRIVKIDKVVIKDSNVYITGNDVIVRRLGERRVELARLRRPEEPDRWWEWPSFAKHGRAPSLLVPKTRAGEAVPLAVPAYETEGIERREREKEHRPIAVLPSRRGEGERALAPTGPLPPSAAPQRLNAPAADREQLRRMREEERRLERERRLEQKRLEEEQRRLERERARERAEAERRAREQRRLEQLKALEERERQEKLLRAQQAEQAKLLRQKEEAARLERQRQREAERLLQEQRRQAAEQAKLLRQQEEAARRERERQREVQRLLEEQRRQQAEQAKLLRRQQEEAARLERQRQREAERAARSERRAREEEWWRRRFE